MDSADWWQLAVCVAFSVTAFIVVLLSVFDSPIPDAAADDGGQEIPTANAVWNIAPAKQKDKVERILVYDTCTKESSNEEVGGGCAICLDEYEDGQQRATVKACSHRFHKDCIEKWLPENDSCPLCRHNLV